MNITGSRNETPGGRVLAILLLAYIFNFIDRQIIGILAVPIKAELQLSDTELSLMGGIAFALFYSGLAIPIAWLADRKSRVRIIAVSVALWSAFTAACGLAQNFWHLFLARMGVGIGEAGGVAPSYALVSDFYPKEKGPGRWRSSRSESRSARRSGSSSAAGSPPISTGAPPSSSSASPAFPPPCSSGSGSGSRSEAATTASTEAQAIRRRPSSKSPQGSPRLPASGCSRSARHPDRSSATASSSGFPASSAGASISN